MKWFLTILSSLVLSGAIVLLTFKAETEAWLLWLALYFATQAMVLLILNKENAYQYISSQDLANLKKWLLFSALPALTFSIYPGVAIKDPLFDFVRAYFTNRQPGLIWQLWWPDLTAFITCLAVILACLALGWRISRVKVV